MNLSLKQCVPCEIKVPPFTRERAEEYLKQVKDWVLRQASSSAGASADRQDDNREEYLFIEVN